jgi:hypothetical protein
MEFISLLVILIIFFMTYIILLSNLPNDYHCMKDYSGVLKVVVKLSVQPKLVELSDEEMHL